MTSHFMGSGGSAGWLSKVSWAPGSAMAAPVAAARCAAGCRRSAPSRPRPSCGAGATPARCRRPIPTAGTCWPNPGSWRSEKSKPSQRSVSAAPRGEARHLTETQRVAAGARGQSRTIGWVSRGSGAAGAWDQQGGLISAEAARD